MNPTRRLVLAASATLLATPALIRVARAEDALRERLAGWPKRDLERFIGRHYPPYWLRTDLDVIAEHAKLIRDAQAQSRPIVTHIATDAFRGVTEITLLAPNHPRLLAMVAGACTGAGANIVDAQISTTRESLGCGQCVA